MTNGGSPLGCRRGAEGGERRLLFPETDSWAAIASELPEREGILRVRVSPPPSFLLSVTRRQQKKKQHNTFWIPNHISCKRKES